MIKLTHVLIAAAALATATPAATRAEAAASIQTTTITDGKFAANTQWYVMSIGQQGYLFTNQTVDGYMPLSENNPIFTDDQLWCATGNATDGYRFYNKAAGTDMQLSAPTNPGSHGTTGAEAYVILADPTTSGRTFTWDMTTSNNLGHAAFYLNVHGQSSQKINNRANRLAFWTGGADAGSSVTFTPMPSLSTDVNGNVWTLSTDPLVTVTGPAGATATPVDGMMQLSEGDWHFSTPEGKIIGKTTVTFADNTSSSHISSGFDNAHHTIHGPATIKVLSYNVMDKLAEHPVGYPLFIYTNAEPFNVPYRIPTILTVQAGEHKGRLIAINDYRYSGADIGSGRIDLYMSYSDDNGLTWSEPGHMYGADGQPVAKGDGAPSQQSDGNGIITAGFSCGFGDPASISDRETGEILVVACAGRMNFFYSTRENPQPSARWWSTDGGQTWTQPDDGQYKQIYALLGDDAQGGPIKGQFIGSGRIIQSRHIKVGSHYRIYCVNSGRAKSDNTIRNWVLYSDDFGRNWKVLGGAAKPGVTSGGDEPKCEELPDGSILLAARGNGGNRNFNIFRYTDIENGQGDWGTHINTNMGMGHGINACNGEIMIVPVKDKATGEKLYMALQSFTNSGGREKVSINWKSLANPADYDEPSDFASWGGTYQVTDQPSAYSTMTLTADNKIGFLYEDGSYAGGNTGTEIFVSLSIETITGDRYEYCADEDFTVGRQAAADMLSHRYSTEAAPSTDGKQYVGRPTAENTAAKTAVDEFNAASDFSYDAIVKFNNEIANTEILMPESGKIYRFMSAQNGTYANITTPRYLTLNNAGKLVPTDKEDDANARFLLTDAREGRDDYLLYSVGAKKLLPASHASTETEMTAVGHAYEASPYTFQVQNNGCTAIVSSLPGNASYPALHFSGSSKIVIWTPAAQASQWYMELMGDAESDIDEADRRHVALTPATAELEVGSEKALTATVRPVWAEDKSVEWSTSAPEVATVDSTGKVTAVAAGIADIAATAGTASATSQITVIDPKLSIDEINADAAAGTTLYDLQGRRVGKAGHGIYVSGNGQKVRI